jgi:hypothetical protein
VHEEWTSCKWLFGCLNARKIRLPNKSVFCDISPVSCKPQCKHQLAGFLGTHWQPDRQQDLLGVSQRARRVSRERIPVEVLHRNTPKTALDEALEALAKNGMVCLEMKRIEKGRSAEFGLGALVTLAISPRGERTVTNV